MQFRIISAPSPGIKEMLLRRTNAQPHLREDIMLNCSAIGLFQTSLPDCYYFADLAQKAGDVVALEINGTCPQRISMMAIFGDIAAVKAAIAAIRNDTGGHD